jgi:hypothetical protein
MSTESVMARAAKYITDITWGTNWNLYLSIFDIVDIAEDVPRLYKSQSWKDPDYPDAVHNLFLTIAHYNEKLSYDFLRYVITNEVDLKNKEYVMKDPALLSSLGIIKGEDAEIVHIPVDISPEEYLDIKVLPNDFYIELQEQINRAFAYNVLSAVPILSRKFLENLIIDILRKKYKGPGIDLYYNPAHRRFHGFEMLLKNLSDKISAGDFAGVSSIFDNIFLRRVNEFREQGNSTAHSIETKIERNTIKDNAEELSFLIKVLLKVLQDC